MKKKILILNAPCNGFGDLIFAAKLSKYLQKKYKAKVRIATTLYEGLKNIGFPKSEIVELKAKKIKQCRRFSGLKMEKIPQQDLIFVAPLQADFSADFRDVKKIIPYSNRENTFFFSEYNDSLNKGLDFNTGIGSKRDGILITDVSKRMPNVKRGKRGKGFKGRGALKNPFALIYVASTLPRLQHCIVSFVEMVAKKYHKIYKNFDIVVPPWFIKEDFDKMIIKKVSKYYDKILIKGRDETINISEGSSRVLTFRADVLPVPNDVMLALMRGSVEDILLTGDQSISDCLSCCPEKNIFYQIAPWKKNFADNLAKYMPNASLKKKSTSCGSIKAISYKKHSYKKFVKDWDFRKRTAKKLDSIIKNDKIRKICNAAKIQKGKICNPATGRWVKKDGKIGKKINAKK